MQLCNFEITPKKGKFYSNLYSDNDVSNQKSNVLNS